MSHGCLRDSQVPRHLIDPRSEVVTQSMGGDPPVLQARLMGQFANHALHGLRGQSPHAGPRSRVMATIEMKIPD